MSILLKITLKNSKDLVKSVDHSQIDRSSKTKIKSVDPSQIDSSIKVIFWSSNLIHAKSVTGMPKSQFYSNDSKKETSNTYTIQYNTIQYNTL